MRSIAAAAFGGRIIRQLLFEVEPLDPASYAGAALFLIAITGLACLLPALRALRINPSHALRSEQLRICLDKAPANRSDNKVT